MRHAQEKAHKELATSPPTHPAKMHHHDPTGGPLLRGDGPVGSSSVTYSLHMSKIPYPPAGGYLCSLSRISLVPGHQWSLNVIKGHCSSHCRPPGGGGRDRTDDLMLAKHALSQLSYAPTGKVRRTVVGQGRLELPTSRLSSARSNQLSYKPLTRGAHAARSAKRRCVAQRSPWRVFVREERETKTAVSRQWNSTIWRSVGP